MRKILLGLVVGIGVLSVSLHAQRRPLARADVDAIATLLKLEDTRQYDEAALGQILKSAHPEVRRRAAVSIGRIADPRGLTLLESAHADRDLQVRASVVFATGQIHQPESVAWLGSVLSAPVTPPAVAKEAAQALGKMVRNEAARPAARAALIAYLAKAVETPLSSPVIGEALLSVGRFAKGEEIAPIAKWATSRNPEIRWRTAWALLRPRDAAGLPHPEALSHLDKLLADPSGEVRNWAVRAFTPAVVDAAGIARPATTARLLRLSQGDLDRRVRTEALRTLLLYDDEAAFGALVNALYSTDFWISGSAAEAAGRFMSRAGRLTALVADVAEPKDSLAMRATVAPSLVTLAPEATATLQLAGQLTQSESAAGRDAGMRALGRLGERGLTAFDQIAADPAMKGILPTREDFIRRNVPQPPAARAGGAAGGRAAGAGGGRGSAPARQPRPDAEYRQLVERWIVPDYNGAAKPHVVWETERGLIEIEVFPGDAPFGVEHLMRVIESGDIVGTEFTRLVPDFVAQQQAVKNASNLRDEVNQRGLTRANLSWASAGLDTGRPGYTLGHTPQPHNEGDFTSLGRVVKGMDAVDKLELGDKIISAKIVSVKK
jgi:HEAT repeat protein/cyclophilin family peptidyl-prolyl cis-trans isomerase